MEVDVKLYTMLREIAGKKTENVALPPKSTVRDLVDLLVERYGEKFARYIYNSEKQVRSYHSYMLNGVNINNLDGFDTMLKNGDILSILPPAGGG